MWRSIFLERFSQISLKFDRHQAWSQTVRATRASRIFLKSCLIDGGRAVFQGRFSTRQGIFIAAGQLPILLGVLLITIPSVLFPTPEHHAFYEFARQLATGAASALPILLGLVCATLGLRIPLG